MEGTGDLGTESANGASGIQNPRARQRALCVGVLSASPGDGDPLAELKELLRTAGVANVGEVVQIRSRPVPDRYLGGGKLSVVEGVMSPARDDSARDSAESSDFEDARDEMDAADEEEAASM